MLTLGRRVGQQILCSHSNGETILISHLGVGTRDHHKQISLRFTGETFLFSASIATHGKIAITLPRSNHTVVVRIDRLTIRGDDCISIDAPNDIKISRPASTLKGAAA